MKLFTLEADLSLATNDFNSGVKTASDKIADLKGDLSGLQTETTNTSTILESALGHAIGDFIGELAGAMTDIVFDIASDGVVLAASMETLNKTMGMTFGESQDHVNAWAKEAKKSFGVGSVAAKQYAVDIGEALKATGASESELANMSTDLIGVAADLAAIKGMNVGDAVSAILSAFRGEADPIERFNLDMKESAMAAYAMEKGLIGAASGWAKLSESEKDMTRYAYIMEATADKQGYFAENSDDYNQQLTLMAANIEQLKLSVGNSLLPVMTDLVSWFNALFGSQEKASDSIDGISESYKDSYADISDTTANALALVNALDSLSKSAETAASTEMWSKIVTELEASIPGIGKLIGNETGKIQAGADALKNYIDQWDATRKHLAQAKVLDDLKSSIETYEAQIAELRYDQQYADIMQTGAARAMDALGSDLLSTMLAGMEKMGASAADIKAMENFGAEGAENLLARIAGGGNANMIMSALLEGGDIWKNKSFMNYFTAGGGTSEQLALWSAAYAAHDATYDEYSSDYTAQIAEYQAAMTAASDKLSFIAEQINDKPSGDSDAAGDSSPRQPVTINQTTTVQVDGQEIAAILIPKVTGAVMNELDWKFQQR